MKKKSLVNDKSQSDILSKEIRGWLKEMERPPQVREVSSRIDSQTLPLDRLRGILKKCVVIKR